MILGRFVWFFLYHFSLEVWGGGEGVDILVCEDWARVGGVYYWVVGGFGEGVGVFLFLGFLGFLVLGCG